jgi:hypothetical protein
VKTRWGRRRRWTSAVALCLLAASACSATGREKAATVARAGAADASDAAAASTETTTAGATAAATAAGAAATAKAGTSAKSASAAAGEAAASAAKTASASGAILVGAYGLGGGAGSGVTGASLGDPVKMSNAMAEWINANGGLGGRPIKLVQAVTDITSSTPVDQQDQAACAKFTEDNKVVAAVSIVTTTSTFYDCMTRKGVFYVNNGITDTDHAYYMAHPSNLFTTTPSQDRIGATQADGLAKAGYFEPGAKYGIVYGDHPWFKAAATAFKRQAAKYGVSVALDGAICVPPCSTQEAANDGQNVALKFVQAGIDHVIAADYYSAAPFMRAAAASGYFPRLGMNSTQLPELAALNSPNPNTFRNAVGIGFMPATDVAEADEPPQNPRTKLCSEIMTKAGQPFPDRLVVQQARFTCDGFWFLKDVLDRTKGNTDANGMRQVVESFSENYGPTLTWKSFFGPTRHDGVQTYRLFAFNLTCNCFRYTSQEMPMTPLPGQPR